MSNEPVTNGTKRGPGRPPGSKNSKSGNMTQEHKDALAQGRVEGAAVRNYLEALRAHKPKRGRKRTIDSVTRRLNAIEEMLPNAEPLDQLRLIQERRNLLNEAETMENSDDMVALEEDFVGVVKSYSERQGISYASWREVGVDPGVLKRGGLTRAGS